MSFYVFVQHEITFFDFKTSFVSFLLGFRIHYWYFWEMNVLAEKGFYSVMLCKLLCDTRMHSSRMRTVRWSGSLSCHARPPPPTTHAPCHVYLPSHMPPAVHASPCNACRLPCMPHCHLCPLPCMHATTPSPCKQNERQTGVKTLPFRNFVCGR